MLKHLRIKNFKGWRDTGDIHLAPITLLFGANSSGKSSISQFLMLLKQTAASSDRRAVFYLEERDSPVDLGSYEEMVYGRDTRNNIEFSYEWTLEDQLELKEHAKGKPARGKYLAFEAKIKAYDSDSNRQKTPILNCLEYKLYNNNSDQNYNFFIKMEKENSTGKGSIGYAIISSPITLTRNTGRGWPLGAPDRFYSFPNEVIARHQNAAFVQDLNLEQEKLFRSICYLGPLRTKAQRLYPWTGSVPDSVGFSGEYTVSALLAAQGRKMNFSFKKHNVPFVEIIADKLKKMGLIKAFEIQSVSDSRKAYEVRVSTEGLNIFVDLPDVGIGISQVLPVLVQCFYAPRNSIILMEQPEIHLHPSAQSTLADVMIDVINSREDGKPRNIQLIIETHSEHFLRRLQRRIAEIPDLQEKVSAYSINIANHSTKLNPLKINEYGEIENWPENFFGDEMEDIIEQANAALKHRRKTKRNSETEHE